MSHIQSRVISYVCRPLAISAATFLGVIVAIFFVAAVISRAHIDWEALVWVGILSGSIIGTIVGCNLFLIAEWDLKA